MRLRRAPAVATWLARLFCSGPERESMMGDLLEQYQRGRGSFWYWRQVIAIGLLGLCGGTRWLLVSAGRVSRRHGPVLIFVIGALSAVLVSALRELALIGILAGILTGSLKWWLGRRERAVSIRSDTPKRGDVMTNHPGISMHHIPVEGAAGLLFAIGTILIFASGIPAVREILLITGPLGVLASGVLIHWRKRHPLKFQALDLRNERHRKL